MITKAILRVATNYPRFTKPPLRLVVPLLLKSKAIQFPHLGKLTADLASFLGLRAYATARLCNGLTIKVPRNDVVGEEIF
ncbi:MAG: hypothetical protein ACRDHZ_22405, partial [Ktedonobacteraceae bacterium]